MARERAAAKGSVTRTRNRIRNSESPKLCSNMPAPSIETTAASVAAARNRIGPSREALRNRAAEPVTIKVLGPGSLVGEVGLVDQEPRSASCTASTDVVCAILTRDAIEALIDAQPRVGAKLLLAISARLAQRLRDNARKLRLYAKLAQAMSMEMSGFIRAQDGA